MSKCFNCMLCDKSIKNESKKKHLNSQYHISLSMSKIFRYITTNPDFLQIENIFKKYAIDYNKKFAFYLIICKWKIHFSDTIGSVKSNTWYSISHGSYLRNFVLSKIKDYEKRGHKFSHISEMTITFISDFRKMTYEHYLNQPKSRLEWKLNAIVARNPELIKTLGNSSHPLNRKYQHNKEDDGEN